MSPTHRLLATVGLGVAAIGAAALLGGPRTSRAWEGNPPATAADRRALYLQADRRLYGEPRAPLSIEGKREVRDQFIAAAGQEPKEDFEFSALTEAARLSLALPEPESAKLLCLRVIENPRAPYASRLDAATTLRIVALSDSDSRTMELAIEAYLRAAREREQDPNDFHRQGYTVAQDFIVRRLPHDLGAALLRDAQRRPPGDQASRQLARRAVEKFDEFLRANPTGDSLNGWLPSPRAVLLDKGLAFAVMGDRANVVSTAEEMSRRPFVNPQNAGESVGLLLERAGEILASSGGSSQPTRQFARGAALMRKHEDLVTPHDPNYVNFQFILALVDMAEQRYSEAVRRLDALLNSTTPAVQEKLGRSPLMHGSILMNRGDALHGMGRTAEARETYQVLLARFPNDPNADSARRKIDEMRADER
jgi:tetratricopeptide (TPR) repeat protein